MRLSVAFLSLALAAAPSFAQDPAPAPPPPPWTSSLGAGLALTSGNSDTTNVNVAFSTAWDPKTDRVFKADALLLRGESDGETQVDKMTALGRYQITSGRTFRFGELSYLRDALKEIDYLIAPIAGLGYHVIKTEMRMLSVDAGAGGAFESNQLGTDSSGAVQAGEAFEWAISPTSKLTQRLTGLWKVDDFDDSYYHFDAGIAATVAARAELKLSYVYDYKSQPPPDVEKGDTALFATLLYKF